MHADRIEEGALIAELRALVRKCIEGGLSRSEIEEEVVRELLADD
jgi:hypothetical protein